MSDRHAVQSEASLAEHNLLTEQKVTKLILLHEELRRDLPMVKDRHDAQSEALKQTPDAQKVLMAIEEGGLIEGGEDERTGPAKPAPRGPIDGPRC